jgi:hypothetical protein
MIAWHGTNKKFDRFSLSKVGTGEGCAIRGSGINAACEKSVALHYMERTPGEIGYLMKLDVPDLDNLINLDAPVSHCVADLESLVSAYYKASLGIDTDDVFDDAANDEGISYSYSDSRAQEMFQRVLINVNDHEAWEELKEWSPDYAWDRVQSKMMGGGLQLDMNDDTGLQLYRSMQDWREQRTERDICIWMSHLGVLGTYGSEPIGSDDKSKDSISLVVFEPVHIRILEVEEYGINDNKQHRDNLDFNP